MISLKALFEWKLTVIFHSFSSHFPFFFGGLVVFNGCPITRKIFQHRKGTWPATCRQLSNLNVSRVRVVLNLNESNHDFIVSDIYPLVRDHNVVVILNKTPLRNPLRHLRIRSPHAENKGKYLSPFLKSTHWSVSVPNYIFRFSVWLSAGHYLILPNINF